MLVWSYIYIANYYLRLLFKVQQQEVYLVLVLCLQLPFERQLLNKMNWSDKYSAFFYIGTSQRAMAPERLTTSRIQSKTAIYEKSSANYMYDYTQQMHIFQHNMPIIM